MAQGLYPAMFTMLTLVDAVIDHWKRQGTIAPILHLRLNATRMASRRRNLDHRVGFRPFRQRREVFEIGFGAMC
jgi:hypothetical protein